MTSKYLLLENTYIWLCLSIIFLKLYCLNNYLYIMVANHEESQNHSKSTQSHYLKIYAKLPLHIKVVLSEFHIFIISKHTHVNIPWRTAECSLICMFIFNKVFETLHGRIQLCFSSLLLIHHHLPYTCEKTARTWASVGMKYGILKQNIRWNK